MSSVLWSDQDEFSEAVGLWKQSAAGHTTETVDLEAVHAGPDAASRLVSLAEEGNAAPDVIHTVLQGLAELQETGEGDPAYGCFRWYAEESRPRDTNAAFFIGLNLLVLCAGYPRMLSGESMQLLRTVFTKLDVWFDRAVEKGSCYYPNKYLGDLVCSQLLKENLEQPIPKNLEEAMTDAGKYWLDHAWGWGEHLSDGYATILMNELSALLLLANRLTDSLRERYRKLLIDLLEIDDFFTGGPRVPAIRSYAFREPLVHLSFRKLMNEGSAKATWLSNAPQLPHLRRFCFGSLFHRLGWQALVNEPKLFEPERTRTTICFGRAEATSHIAGDFRLGSLSRFPLMPGTDHAGHGLSWQSMPVVFNVANQTQGFLRWGASEAGVERFHPALHKNHAYLRNALSDVTTPPVVGLTSALQRGSRLVVLRSMPVLSNEWEYLGDGWDLTGQSPDVIESSPVCSGGSKIVLRFSVGFSICLWHIPVSSKNAPQVQQDSDFWSWSLREGAADLRRDQSFAHLWFVGSPDDADPVLENQMRCVPTAGAPIRTIVWPAFGEAIHLHRSRLATDYSALFSQSF